MTSCVLTPMMKSSQDGVYSKRKEFAPRGANSVLYEMTPISMGGNNVNDRVASPESVPINFNSFLLCTNRHVPLCWRKQKQSPLGLSTVWKTQRKLQRRLLKW